MNQRDGGAGPQRRVANRKRSGPHHGAEISKRAKNYTGSQTLVAASQRYDIEDGSDADETGAPWHTQNTQSPKSVNQSKIYSQHGANKICGTANKRPLFKPCAIVGASQHALVLDDIPSSMRDGGGRDETDHRGDEDLDALIEEWAEDEFRADEITHITSTPSSSNHVEVIAPATVCNHLSPVANRQHHQTDLPLPPQHKEAATNQIAGDEWDDEDSLYEKLDLSQIVAESQESKKDGCNNASKPTVSTGSTIITAGYLNSEGTHGVTVAGVHKTNTGVKQGSVVLNHQATDDVDLQWDDVDDWNSTDKCSVARTTVMLNSSNSGVTATGDGQPVCAVPSSSVTPVQEKWFSHIGSTSHNQHAGGTGPNDQLMCNSSANLSSRPGAGFRTKEWAGQSQSEAGIPQPGQGLKNVKQSITIGRTSGDSGHLGDTPQRNTSSAALKQLSHGLSNAKSSTPTHNRVGGRGQPCQTPQSSIGNRLKQRLQNNAKVITPVQNRAAKLRKASIEVAMSKAIEVKDQANDKDVGPFYGLPSKVQELLKEHRGIGQFYDWQHSCLTLKAVQEGRNLIYSLPTSGGKTLVAEILIMQQLLCHKKDAILVVPYVAIVQEKVTNLSVFAVELGFLVEEYAGSKGAIPPRKRRKKRTLYVATIEKAHSLVNSLIQDQRIGNVGLVVVDELHMLGDGGRRGATLEMCLSKLIYTNAAQIVGMSATLSNIQDLCTFMKAEVYTSDFRPVELKEYIKVEDNIFEVNPGALCPDEKFVHSRTVTFPYSRSLLKSDPDHLIGLALEVIPDFSCLIFCATKKNCQNVAEIICKHMPRDFAKKIMAHKSAEKKSLLLSLRRECDNHLCSTLKKTVPFGLAYHHSGLTMDERKLIEDAYSEGVLCLLTCTSTLAAGVNLPAKRVMLRSPYIAKDLLTSSRYKQMVGRAGRAGIDTSGESIMIIKPKERSQVTDMLSGPLEGCYSSLMHDDGKGMRGLVLTLVALKITKSRQSVVEFMHLTLFGVQTQESEQDLSEFTHNAVQQLIELELVKEKSDDNKRMVLETTKLGLAAFKGSIDIDMCSTVYRDLKFACDQGLVLANALHLLYLVTPYDQVETTQPNWNIYDRQYAKLGESERKVSDMIGVTDLYLSSKITGNTVRADKETNFRIRRFYLTLMLWNLLNQKSIWDVAARFDVPRGFIQNLFASAASFASSVHRFCEDLPEFWAFQQLLSKVVYDLTYLATSDIVSLLEVPGVKQGRANQLVKAGYKTLRHLAHADPDLLMQEMDHLPRKVALQMVSAAKMELAERAEALREEAEELASKPMYE